MITFSTTYIPEIVAIGEAGSIVGVDNAASVSAPELRSRIASGATVETTRNSSPNLELMISLSPDAIFAYGMGDGWDVRPKMAEAGLPVVIDGDWNEATPLARAEWVEFIAAFYDKEDLASAYSIRSPRNTSASALSPRRRRSVPRSSSTALSRARGRSRGGGASWLGSSPTPAPTTSGPRMGLGRSQPFHRVGLRARPRGRGMAQSGPDR